MKALLFLALLFYSCQSFAEVEVAFIEIRNPDGKIHQLEPGGRFAHVAISYKGQWLHVHPYRGVEIVSLSELEKIGVPIFVSVPEFNELSATEVNQFVGKPYDRTFTWDGEGYYCSELIGKILGMEPLPMSFQAEVWTGKINPNKLGLSPDDIYQKILEKIYRASGAPRCESIFEGT